MAYHEFFNGPVTLHSFYRLVSDEAKAWEAAMAWGLVPNLLCPARLPIPDNPNSICGLPMNKEPRKNQHFGFRWRCRRGHVGCVIPPTKNTIFYNKKMTIEKALTLIVLFSEEWNVGKAAVEARVSQKAAIDFFHKLRGVMTCASVHDGVQVGGPQDVVEVDEAHLFQPKYHRGRRPARDIWVFGCISRITGNIWVEKIVDKSRNTLEPIMRAHIRRRSYIMSDHHRAYRGCAVRLGMKGHSFVNHQRTFVAPPVAIQGVPPRLGHPTAGTRAVLVKVYTNTIERQWLELKKQLRSCRRGHMVRRYIGAYMYRRNVLRNLPQPHSGTKLRKFLDDITRVFPGYGIEGIRSLNCVCAACAHPV